MIGIHVFFTHFKSKLSQSLFDEKLLILPAFLQTSIKKYRRWQDAHSSLFGKLLLLRGIESFGLEKNLNDLKFTQYGKPYFDDDDAICFNITHSGGFVLCAIGDEVDSLGVDIEQIKPINFVDFRNVWTDSEWDLICKQDERIFYDFWTKKEAIIKAHGQGLSLNLREIDVRKSEVLLNGNTYYLEVLNFSNEYSAHIAATKRLDRIDLVEVQF